MITPHITFKGHFAVRGLGAVELEHKEKVTNRYYLRNMVPVGIAMVCKNGHMSSHLNALGNTDFVPLL